MGPRSIKDLGPITFILLIKFVNFQYIIGGRHGSNRVVVGFITTYAISAYHQ
jgi:hypothetical protein